ncbi:hypothetical protein BDW75DRAFT_231069 [Aspergillus navahoensis]
MAIPRHCLSAIPSPASFNTTRRSQILTKHDRSCPTFSYSAWKGSPTPDTLVELAKARRTIYQLGSNSPVPDSEIEKLVHAGILNMPSAFNTQLTRLLVLLHREHERLWDVVIDVFQNLVKTGAIPNEGFQAGVGTTQRTLSHSPKKFALYKDQFQPWAEHSNAMHQYFLWTGLKSLGFGANLQHYTPLIGAPWRLVAQLVFGSPKGDPGKKIQKPIGDRFKIYGKQ